MLGDASSSHAPLFYDVPQGSILGPLLFTIYMLPQGQIMCRHYTDFHCYTDDTQLHVTINPSATDVSCIRSCLAEMKNWISKNFLQLNVSESEIIMSTSSGRSTSSIEDLSSFDAQVT